MVVLDNHIDYREGTAVEAVPVAFFAAVVPLTDTAAVAAAEDRARELHSLSNRNLDLLRALVADNRVLRSELQHERRRTAEAECAPLGLAAAPWRAAKELCVRWCAEEGKEVPPPRAPMEEVPSASAATAEDRAKGWRSLNGRNLDMCSALMADNHALLGKLQHTRERRRTAEAECAQRELAAAPRRAGKELCVAAEEAKEVPSASAAAPSLPLPLPPQPSLPLPLRPSLSLPLPLPPALQPSTSLVGGQGGRSKLCRAQAPCTRGGVATAKQDQSQIAASRLASRFADDRTEVHMRSCYASAWYCTMLIDMSSPVIIARHKITGQAYMSVASYPIFTHAAIKLQDHKVYAEVNRLGLQVEVPRRFHQQDADMEKAVAMKEAAREAAKEAAESAAKGAKKAATQRKKLAKEQGKKWPAAQAEAAKVGRAMPGWRALMVLSVAIVVGTSMAVFAAFVSSSSAPMHASTASSSTSGSGTMCATVLHRINSRVISLPPIIHMISCPQSSHKLPTSQVQHFLAFSRRDHGRRRVQRKWLHVRHTSAYSASAGAPSTTHVNVGPCSA